MSRRAKSPEIDLKLHLSPPRVATNYHNHQSERSQSPNTSVSSMEIMSPDSSCVSWDLSHNGENSPANRYMTNSPEQTSSPMMLVGCPQCLMYVMLSEVDPKCPKCKSTVLLDFLNDELSKKTIN